VVAEALVVEVGSLWKVRRWSVLVNLLRVKRMAGQQRMKFGDIEREGQQKGKERKQKEMVLGRGEVVRSGSGTKREGQERG